jgi:hypothetical protein
MKPDENLIARAVAARDKCYPGWDATLRVVGSPPGWQKDWPPSVSQ